MKKMVNDNFDFNMIDDEIFIVNINQIKPCEIQVNNLVTITLSDYYIGKIDSLILLKIGHKHHFTFAYGRIQNINIYKECNKIFTNIGVIICDKIKTPLEMINNII
jgi:hypothetical protein